VNRRAEIVSIYARIWCTYRNWAPSLLLLAAIVFVPLGLVHAVALESQLDELSFGTGLELLTTLVAVLALTATGLVGEVFYTGAVSIVLTHPHDGQPPSLREIAGMISYGPLIAIDLIYGSLVALGIVLLVAPGLLAFVWLGLAAPVAEIEKRGVRESFLRSVRLVRGKLLVVALVLIPIELLGDALTDVFASVAHGLLPGHLLSEWLTDALANIAFTPFYAVAAVLIAVDRIREKDGGGVDLRSQPVSPQTAHPTSTTFYGTRASG
jgi:hypothetical protein